MVQAYLNWLPTDVGQTALVLALLGAFVGAALWLAGARFSRMLVGLIGVTAGGAVGMKLPDWMGWSIGGAGPAVAVALVLGLSAYVMHRAWIGLGLGVLLAAWTTAAVAVVQHIAVQWPADLSSSMKEAAPQLWAAVPAQAHTILLTAWIASLATGVALAIFSPRLAVALAWSVAGASLLVGAGSAAVAFSRPQWLALLPQHNSAQALSIGVLIALGAALQWYTARFSFSGVPMTTTTKGGPIISSGKPKPSPRPPADGAD